MPHPNIFNAHSPPINTQQSCSLFHIWWKLGMVTNYSAVNYLLLLWSWLWLLCQTHSFIHLLCLVRWTFWRLHRLLHMKNGLWRKNSVAFSSHVFKSWNSLLREALYSPVHFFFLFRYVFASTSLSLSFKPQICSSILPIIMLYLQPTFPLILYSWHEISTINIKRASPCAGRELNF